MQKIYLLRHGQTEWSKSMKHTGLTDIPLIEEGVHQADTLFSAIKDIKFEAVYCSSLQRAKQTCERCKLLQEAIIDDDLLEWDYGDYEGITSKEIHKTNPGWTIFNQDPKNGETAAQVAKRADSIILKALSHKGDVALFSSGHFLRSLGARWLSQDVSFGAYLTLSTASLCVLSFEHDNQVIHSWNNTFY